MKKITTKLIIVILIAAIGLTYGISYFLKPGSSVPHQQITEDAIKFRKDGELSFIKNDSSLLKIEIEIADNDNSRMQGLMYRKHMAETEGMLFIFDYESPQTFWMKNTHLTLDMIFINRALEVVSIQKYTQPYSEGKYPSEGSALYVLEVVGGFSDRHNIQPGDKIRFSRSGIPAS
ncbi:MAG: DUF192 domain-containing protein [Bacteroidetes bacterium]|nr:DUF192 domain-containing protein [Bacteroidota bacterium]